jgi:hypothetical protein
MQDSFDFHDDEPEAPYQHHSETSREAAELIEPDADTLRGRVLAYIRERGAHGATDEEIQDALHMNPSTERPRRIELWNAEWVLKTSDTRLTRSGRKATVWIAAEEKA